MRGREAKVVFYGVGAIGSGAARYALSKEWVEVVGAVDSDEDKAGKDLGEVVGLGRKIGVEVSPDPGGLFDRVKADIVVLTTGSFFRSVYDQLELAARAGVNVITTAEELAFPSLQNPGLARELDELAKFKAVSITAAGINPGFVMDKLIAFLSKACLDVTAVRAKRVVDCASRRGQLQLKVGAGLTVEEFKGRLGRSLFGHVGLLESAALVADALERWPDRIVQTIEPVVAEEPIFTDHVEVKRGQVAGMRQVARCLKDGEDYVRLETEFYLGAPNPRDEIFIEGSSPVDLVVRGGIDGDSATVALLINSIPAAVTARPGIVLPTGKGVSEIKWQCAVDRGF